MTTETKKPWEKDPITKEEWRANQAAIKVVRDEDAAEFRLIIKKKLVKLAGREWDPKWANFNLTAILVKNGYLEKPTWHDRSTLTLDHYPLEELSALYMRIKSLTKKVEVDEPF